MISKNTYNSLCESYDTLCEAVDALVENEWPDGLIADVMDYIGGVTGFVASKVGIGSITGKLAEIGKGIATCDSETVISGIASLRGDILDCEGLVLTSEALGSETDLSGYIDLLAIAAEDGYTIFLTTMDTPCGSSNFTFEIGAKICSLGIGVNLFNRFRASYCAVIDGGEVDQQYSDTHSVSISKELNGNRIFIDSAGMMKVDCVRHSNIKINDRQVGICRRGLSFVVYDKDSDTVLDSYIISNQVSFYDLNGFRGDSPLFKHLKRDEIKEVLTVPDSYVGTDGARHMKDHHSKYFNTSNGHRITVGQPDNPKRTIYVLGGCNVLGIGARDEATLASQLQKLLNENVSEEGFIVENYGFALDGTDSEKEMISTLRALELAPGDIVLGFGDGTLYSDYDHIRECGHKRGELFFDSNHYTEVTHAIVAESVLITLKKNGYFRDMANSGASSANKGGPGNTITPNDSYGFSDQELRELQKYKEMLSDLYSEKLKGADDIGSIVMNCNPFTLGHRYLIEEAAKRCDKLIIFVVQEDKSEFKFRDRIELVRKGTSDLENVFVVESGSFIISSITFQEYFNKSSLQNRTVDSSEDVTIFANEIAPSAHIKKRFVGTEPFDMVTRQYNRTLERILPRHGIEFIEIPRKSVEDSVISASKVRELLAKKDFDSIRKYVPESTLAFIQSTTVGVSK